MSTTSASAQIWRRVRTLFEAPIMDDHKWAKVPTIAADAFFLDLEDSVPPALRPAARARVIEYLGREEYFRSALPMPRMNHLGTEWGRADAEALATAGAKQVMVPKVDSTQDLDEVAEVFTAHGTLPALIVTVETVRGLLAVEELAADERVCCLAFGAADFAVDAGIELLDGEGNCTPLVEHAKLRVALAAASRQLGALGVPWVGNIRDLEAVERRAQADRLIGFTGAITFYPPHVGVLNAVFGVSAEQRAEAEEIVATYEAALRDGRTGVQRADGSVLLVHQYKHALSLLVRAG